MIRRTVSAALLLRDGFTGRPISPAAGVLCRLDGRSIRPMRKNDGYLVLVDLEPGEHALSLRARGYREEELTLTVHARSAVEFEVDLIPGEGYPVPPDTARLRVTVSGASGENLWAAMASQDLLKLAQAIKKDTEPVTEVRLFCSGSIARLPVPGAFLAVDQKGPEIIRLTAVQGETGELSEPFAKAHSRGTELRPARLFRTNDEGKVELLFPRGGEVILFCRDQWVRTELMPGEQDYLWSIS